MRANERAASFRTSSSTSPLEGSRYHYAFGAKQRQHYRDTSPWIRITRTIEMITTETSFEHVAAIARHGEAMFGAPCFQSRKKRKKGGKKRRKNVFIAKDEQSSRRITTIASERRKVAGILSRDALNSLVTSSRVSISSAVTHGRSTISERLTKGGSMKYLRG